MYTPSAAGDPLELEQPGGDRGGQGAVEVPAALGPVDALSREVPAGPPHFGDIYAERSQRSRSGPCYCEASAGGVPGQQALAKQGIEQPDAGAARQVVVAGAGLGQRGGLAGLPQGADRQRRADQADRLDRGRDLGPASR